MVLGDVPLADRCRCNEVGAPKATVKAAKAVKGAPGRAEAPEGALAKFSAWLRR
jgi:hypothetical protein